MRRREMAGCRHPLPFAAAAGLALGLALFAHQLLLTLAAVVIGPLPAVQTALYLSRKDLSENAAQAVSEPAQETQAEPAQEAPALPAGDIEAYLVPLEGNEARPEGAGAILEKNYPQASVSSADIAAEITNPLPFAVEWNSPDPQILIMHTHATEDYRLSAGLWYRLGDGSRTTDRDLNMCAVGRVMADTLNAAGLNTLHDETLNDYPSYTGSYANSRAVVQQYLSQYPSIKIVLDVHRDAIETENGSRMAPVCTVNGRQAAQVMIICGCDNGTTVSLPNYRLNLRFAAAWLHPPGPVQLPVLQSGSDPRQPAHRDRRARQQPERGPLCRAAGGQWADFCIKTVKPPSPHLLLWQVRPALFAKGSPIRGAGERMRD